MILLKDILTEVFSEVRKHGKLSGEDEITIDFDGQFIPGLAKNTDTIEVTIQVPYNFDPGSKQTHWDPGEGASVELETPYLTGVAIHPEKGDGSGVDIRFLHPRQLKILESLIGDYVEKNREDIENKILNGIGD